MLLLLRDSVALAAAASNCNTCIRYRSLNSIEVRVAAAEHVKLDDLHAIHGKFVETLTNADSDCASRMPIMSQVCVCVCVCVRVFARARARAHVPVHLHVRVHVTTSHPSPPRRWTRALLHSTTSC